MYDVYITFALYEFSTFADKNDGSSDGECNGDSYTYHCSGNTICTNRYTHADEASHTHRVDQTLTREPS